MTNKPEKIEAPKNTTVTSYNEFIKRFYPEPTKTQLAKEDSSQSLQARPQWSSTH